MCWIGNHFPLGWRVARLDNGSRSLSPLGGVSERSELVGGSWLTFESGWFSLVGSRGAVPPHQSTCGRLTPPKGESFQKEKPLGAKHERSPLWENRGADGFGEGVAGPLGEHEKR